MKQLSLDLKDFGLEENSYFVEVTIYESKTGNIILSNPFTFFLFPCSVCDFVCHFDFSQYNVSFRAVPLYSSVVPPFKPEH